MEGVLNFIGRLFWLSVLTFVFGFICVSLTQLEHINTKPKGRQFNASASLQKTVKLNKVASIAPKNQQIANIPEPLPSPPGPSLITTVLGAMDYITKLQKPYWPYREGIDCAVQKCVALTFDDGPSVNTLPLLDILKSKNAVATFFVTGYNINTHKDVLRRMISDKDEIGNHGFGHKNFKKISTPDVNGEVGSVQDAVFSATGYRPHIFRPPYGEFRPGEPALNNTPIIFWNNDPDDWKNRNPSVVDANVMTPIKPGSIVVMHDLYPSTVSAVPKVIDNLQAQGYTLVTVTELFGWKDPATPLPNGQLLRSR
ncbi:MAG: polysaccharide deacetylase family protein [Candidatus Saccharibacteria bacterium]